MRRLKIITFRIVDSPIVHGEVRCYGNSSSRRGGKGAIIRNFVKYFICFKICIFLQTRSIHDPGDVRRLKIITFKLLIHPSFTARLNVTVIPPPKGVEKEQL